MRRVVLLTVLFWAGDLGAQPSELFNCLEPGTFCSESQADTLDTLGQGCGQTFLQFTGRVAWPRLVYLAPITIAVKTLATDFTPYPLYVEVRNRNPDSLACTTFLAGATVLEAQSSSQCGGVWETVGPLDLTQAIGVPFGGLYDVQAVFFRDAFSGWRSVGLGCIRVTADKASDAVSSTTAWSRVKALYK